MKTDRQEFLRPLPVNVTMPSITVSRDQGGDDVIVGWRGDWHDKAPPIEVRLPGFSPVVGEPGAECVELTRRDV